MIFSLRKLTLAMALCGVVGSPLLAAENPQPLRVLASLPITYGLGEVLLKGTDVSLERAAPANLPGSRQTAYFTGRGAPALGKLASNADAVIGVRSLWADDPLYPIARRSNIRIVEVDAARPGGWRPAGDRRATGAEGRWLEQSAMAGEQQHGTDG